MLWDRNNKACDTRDGDGDGNYGLCYRIEALINVIDVMAMMLEVMDIVIGWKL